MPKTPTTPIKTTDLLDDRQVAALSKLMKASVGDHVFEQARKRGVNAEDIIRYTSLAARLREAREGAGLTIKQVAAQLRVPQYRIRDTESGPLNVQDEVLRKYVDYLGLAEWYEDWRRQNPKLTKRISQGRGGDARHGGT